MLYVGYSSYQLGQMMSVIINILLVACHSCRQIKLLLQCQSNLLCRQSMNSLVDIYRWRSNLRGNDNVI